MIEFKNKFASRPLSVEDDLLILMKDDEPSYSKDSCIISSNVLLGGMTDLSGFNLIKDVLAMNYV